MLLLAFLIWVPALAWSQDVQVTASVGADSVGVQDQFQLSVTVSGKDSGDAENPRVSRLQGFRVVSGPNISTQFQWVNGRSNSSKSFVYILIPEKEGQFTIDPIEVKIGGKVLKTQPLQVRVTSGSRNPPIQNRRPLNPLDLFEDEENIPSRKSLGDSVFIKAELDQASAYPGQQVTLSYQLYTQVGINGIQIQENPPLSGFWVEDLEVEKNPRGAPRVVNGRDYQVYTIKKQALFATATGKLKIPSSTFAISAGTGGDLLGVFGRAQTLYRKTDELALDIKPLPVAGRPADFRNAVGSFKLSAGIDKTQVATGEAVSFHVKLEGKGNLKMIPDISMPAVSDFTVYSSKRVDSIRTLAENQIGGEKTWEFVVVAKAPGKQTIPSLSFSFFNTERDAYETISTSPLALNVVRGSDTGVSESLLSGSDKQNLVRQGTDINFIKMSSGVWEQNGKPLYRSLWLYWIAVVPVLLNAAIFLYRRQRSGNAGNVRLARSRKARRTAINRLKGAERQGRADTRQFYDQASAALSGYLTDKFGMKEIELTGDNLERALSEKSIPRSIVEETGACLQECDFGRFVSATASVAKTKELSTRIRKVIDALEGTRKKFPSASASLILVLLFASWNLYALPNQGVPERLFAQGNAEYQKGNYESAERYYSQILNSGFDSGPLYFNLGNACFKQKRLGDAIYYWEKAKTRLPGDREIQENLELANLLIPDRIEISDSPFPVRAITAATGIFTVKQETWMVLALFIAANVLLALCMLAKNSRNSFRALLCCMGLTLLLLVSASSLSWKIYDQDYRKKGIVVEQKVDVRSGPGSENMAVFTIHEGMKVRVHTSNNGWYQISLPNGWSGWLRQDCIRIL
ncbi:MAG TPA: BatD family protein [Acidobacteriota bacterium]|nr:BatD family protein [Acidobacteriota bacterium]